MEYLLVSGRNDEKKMNARVIRLILLTFVIRGCFC